MTWKVDSERLEAISRLMDKVQPVNTTDQLIRTQRILLASFGDCDYLPEDEESP